MIVLDRAYELIRALRVIFPKIRAKDADEAKQLKKAANSVVRNIGEGHRRRGQDRMHLWRIAAGSADEVQKSLWACEAWGYVSAAQCAPALAKADEVLAMMWRLTEG